MATLPQGLHRDEAFNVVDEASISWAHHPVFFDANAGREALFFYWQNLLLHGLGVTTFSVRLASTTVAVVTIALQISVMRRLFGWRAGLLSGLVLATLYWHVQESRLGLRASTMPIWVLLLVAATTWAIHRRQARAFAIPALVCVGATYTYTAGRVLPAFLVVAILGLLLANRSCWCVWLRGVLVATAVYVVLVLPLTTHLLTHPVKNERVGDLVVLDPRASVLTNAHRVYDNAIDYAETISVAGDRQWIVNLPGRPIFDPTMGTLFYVGVLVLVLQVLINRPDLNKIPPPSKYDCQQHFAS